MSGSFFFKSVKHYTTVLLLDNSVSQFSFLFCGISNVSFFSNQTLVHTFIDETFHPKYTSSSKDVRPC